MGRTLLVCSSTDGQTRRICERLAGVLRGERHDVALIMIEDAGTVDPAAFDLVVVGARIRYGRTDARVKAFANRHAGVLNTMPSAFFSVNVVARKPGRDRPETNPYVQAFVRDVAWRPRLLEVFAGRLDYPRYGVLDRCIIRFIMWLTDGPTARDTVVEFTDWRRVAAFGHRLAADWRRVDAFGHGLGAVRQGPDLHRPLSG